MTHSMNLIDAGGAPGIENRKRPWSAPEVRELPRLTELTLQSFIPGEGFPGGGGSTVF